MPTFVLDIETTLCDEFAHLIKRRDPEANDMPPVWAQKITCLGLATLNDDMTLKGLSIGCMGDSEAESLNLLSKAATNYKFITFNGRSFDIPIILNRMMHFGVQAPWYYSNPDYRYRYSDKGHLDLMDFLSDFGATQRKDRYSLNSLVTILGLPPKIDFNKPEDGHTDPLGLATYCLGDVLLTTLAYYKFSYFRGTFDKAYLQNLILGFTKILSEEIHWTYSADKPSPLRNVIEPNVPVEAFTTACQYILSQTNWQKFGMWE